MSNLRTPEQLTEYFNAFRLKKQREKQKKSQQKKAKRLDEYRAIEKRLKEEKRENTDKLINEHQQWLQGRKKQPIQQFYVVTDVGDFNEDNLYSTWEEIEADTSGRLNPNYREFIKRTRHFCCFFA